jgi:ComF family protein
MIPKERVKLYPKADATFCYRLHRFLPACIPRLLNHILQADYKVFGAVISHAITIYIRRIIAIPHHCILCDSKTAQRICVPCQQQFFYCPRYSCSACALPLAYSALLCGGCLKKRPAFDRVHSPYLYQAPLSNLIFQFKEQRDFFSGEALADLWCDTIRKHMTQQHSPLPDMITAVPLHWQKQGLRGFNQAAFFAYIIHQKLNIPLFKNVKRIESISEQKSLDRKQRLKNVEDSFTTTGSLHNMHIAIIDDVMTTGATVNALTLSLKKAGATKVSVWVLARVPK